MSPILPARPLRVALVAPMWPYRGGIAHFATAMARDLAARGHRVDAVTFARQYPDRLFPGRTQFDDGPPPEGAPLARRALDSLDPRTWTDTAAGIAARGADVAVLHTWMPFLAPALGTLARALRRRGVPVVTVVHNALPHERRPFDRPLSRYALVADRLVVMNESVRTDVAALGATAPVSLVPHPPYAQFGAPVDRAVARRALGLPEDAPVFLFFGFVRRYKGLHVLLDAVPAVAAAVPGAQVVVAGEFYGDEAALRAQASGLPVRFDAAYIADDAVAPYFGAATAVVQPYVSATQSGVAGVAFHFGRAVVTTDVGGLAEGVGDAGLVVPPEDPPALAAALVRVAAEPGLRERLEAAASAQARAGANWADVSAVVEATAEAAARPAAP